MEWQSRKNKSFDLNTFTAQPDGAPLLAEVKKITFLFAMLSPGTVHIIYLSD
jgi:hypothetical protein